MTNLSRRGAMMIPVGLFFAGVVGCAQTAASLPQWATDVANIATDLKAYVGTLPGSVATSVGGVIDKIGSIAGQITGALSAALPGNVTGLVSGFSSLLSGLLPQLGGSGALSGLGTFGTILQAGLQLLPVILSLAGVVLAGAAPLPDARTVAAARAYLAALAHG